MRIAITYDLKEDWTPAADDPVDVNAEFDSPKTVDMIADALESGGHQIEKIGNVYALLPRLKILDVDLVFNICEGRGGRNRESQVPLLLEMHGIPFVGADALTLGITLDKVMAKKIFLSDGIPTPEFFSASPGDDLSEVTKLRFPLIVKTRYEGTSKGLSENSVVYNETSLRKQIAYIYNTYHQPALIERFIRGTEFTVAVIDNNQPEAMPVVQVGINGKTDLGDNFFTYENVQDVEAIEYICPAGISDDLTQKLKNLAIATYKSVECCDFGRIDFRVDEQGQPFVLEINPYPSLAENDVFNIFPQTIGLTYADVMNRIVGCALRRYETVGPRSACR